MPWNAIILCIHYSGEACVDSYYFLEQHKIKEVPGWTQMFTYCQIQILVLQHGIYDSCF